MTAAALQTIPSIDPLSVFEARLEARCYLVAHGKMDKANAVDALQEWAEREGLVDRYGQDFVQATMAAAFRDCTP